MQSAPRAVYEFGRFTLISTENRLLCDGKAVPLAPKVFDTLRLLVENHGRLVQKEALLKALWPDTVVEEVGLAHNVSHLRKVLGDLAEDPKFIETVPKRGYRFVAAVQALDELPARHASVPTNGVASPVVQHAARSRLAIVATVAAVLGLIAAGSAYRYWPRAGQRAAGASPEIHSLVVLPLENLSGDKEQQYFADGITDALTTELAQIGSLRVISRTSAMQFQGSRQTLPQISQQLKVDAVVEGTVARTEDRVRVTAQLIEASSDRHLWARSFERDIKDVLSLQDEVAKAIAEQIRIELTPTERTRLAQGHMVDPEAYDAYLKGRYWWSKRTAEGEWQGLDYFQKAVAADPTYALAYAGGADSFVVLGFHGQLPPGEALPRGKNAATKALELDPSLAEAHTSLGIIKFSNDWDWPGAEQEFKQALTLNPNYATAHHWYSHYLVAMGRLDEAVSELERARDLDPFSVPVNVFLGQALYYARRYDDALRQFRRGLEMYPDRVEFYEGIARVYEQKKMFAETFVVRQQSLRLTNDIKTASTLEDAYRRSGYEGYLREKARILEQAPHLDMSAVLFLAHLYALLDDEAHAMLCLERAYKERDPWLLNVQVDPAMDFMHSSSRFRSLVARIGLPVSESGRIQ